MVESRSPMTDAERAKFYRERKGDEYRKANRERMAAKRREAKDAT